MIDLKYVLIYISHHIGVHSDVCISAIFVIVTFFWYKLIINLNFNLYFFNDFKEIAAVDFILTIAPTTLYGTHVGSIGGHFTIWASLGHIWAQLKRIFFPIYLYKLPIKYIPYPSLDTRNPRWMLDIYQKPINCPCPLGFSP